MPRDPSGMFEIEIEDECAAPNPSEFWIQRSRLPLGLALHFHSHPALTDGVRQVRSAVRRPHAHRFRFLPIPTSL